MNIRTIFIIIYLVMESNAISQNITSQLKIDSIQSKIWGEKRDVKIFIPQEYFDSVDFFPVVYVLDGQSSEMFNYCSSVINYLIAASLIRPTMVVGISSNDRIYEYTPVPNSEIVKERYGKDQKFGGTSKTIQFLEEEIIPYINRNYRTNGFKTLLGHSLGATLATSLLIQRPGLFNAYVLASPNYLFSEEMLVKQFEDSITNAKNKNAFIYISYGIKDEVERKFRVGTEKIKKQLESRTPKGLQWSIKPSKSLYHAISFFESFPDGLIELQTFLSLSDPQLSVLYSKSKKDFVINVKKFYDQKSEWASCAINPSSDDITRIADLCMDKSNTEDAMKIYDWGISLYPKEFTLYGSQGNACLTAQKNSLAKKYFLKANDLLDIQKNKLSIEEYTYFKESFNAQLKKAESEKPKE